MEWIWRLGEVNGKRGRGAGLSLSTNDVKLNAAAVETGLLSLPTSYVLGDLKVRKYAPPRFTDLIASRAIGHTGYELRDLPATG